MEAERVEPELELVEPGLVEPELKLVEPGLLEPEQQPLEPEPVGLESTEASVERRPKPPGELGLAPLARHLSDRVPGNVAVAVVGQHEVCQDHIRDFVDQNLEPWDQHLGLGDQNRVLCDQNRVLCDRTSEQGR